MVVTWKVCKMSAYIFFFFFYYTGKQKFLQQSPKKDYCKELDGTGWIWINLQKSGGASTKKWRRKERAP
jgi:hypothetical protein